ncbi:MAG: hypothetical protein MI919_13535, partial [Holophagales bacterium]|nr:hypothetical protein [Holophagales bacterium]
MRKIIPSCFLIVFSLLACEPTPPPPDARDSTVDPPATGTLAAEVIYLDQGWTAALREQFYFTPQGSQLIPYKWFLALEKASANEPFVDDAYFDSVRYLPAPASDLNADGLPVGFTFEPAQDGGEGWLGLTCAACHTAQIEYRDSIIRIDGGPAMAD